MAKSSQSAGNANPSARRVVPVLAKMYQEQGSVTSEQLKALESQAATSADYSALQDLNNAIAYGQVTQD